MTHKLYVVFPINSVSFAIIDDVYCAAKIKLSTGISLSVYSPEIHRYHRLSVRLPIP